MTFPEGYRASHPLPMFASSPGDPFGYFLVPAREAYGRALQIIATDGQETQWEHVSVSIVGQPTKCPSWPEMCLVKDLFWNPEACVIQFHPPASQYVNHHPGCLHLWRHTEHTFPTPPTSLVGPK
jgi:hypothetical protein